MGGLCLFLLHILSIMLYFLRKQKEIYMNLFYLTRWCVITTIIAFTSILSSGCETSNPVCSESYCVTGEIFPRDQLKRRQKFDELPATVDEAAILAILRGDAEPAEQPTVQNQRTLYGVVTDTKIASDGHGGYNIVHIVIRAVDFKKYRIIFESPMDRHDVSGNDFVVVRLLTNFKKGTTQYKGKLKKNVTERLTFN